jgi:hypothetical protein
VGDFATALRAVLDGGAAHHAAWAPGVVLVLGRPAPWVPLELAGEPDAAQVWLATPSGTWAPYHPTWLELGSRRWVVEEVPRG